MGSRINGFTLEATSRKAKHTGPKRRARRNVGKVLALVVGAVGCSVLALSVWHCTEALALLTGSSLTLAFLMAVGIDCGLVACEVSSVLTSGDGQRWANRYVVLAVVLSMVLNSVASGHAAEGYSVLAYAVGAVVPVLVWLLGKVSGHLWQGK
jgi:hypothetical protein